MNHSYLRKLYFLCWIKPKLSKFKVFKSFLFKKTVFLCWIKPKLSTFKVLSLWDQHNAVSMKTFTERGMGHHWSGIKSTAYSHQQVQCWLQSETRVPQGYICSQCMSIRSNEPDDIIQNGRRHTRCRQGTDVKNARGWMRPKSLSNDVIMSCTVAQVRWWT